MDFQEAEVEGAGSIPSDTLKSNSTQSNNGEFEVEIRNQSMPDGWQFVGSLYEQALFDQHLRTEHKMGLWEFIRMFGVEATNAALDEFEHSCGHHLDNWWNKRQSVHEASSKREVEREAKPDLGTQVKKRRLTGKQAAPLDLFGSGPSDVDRVLLPFLPLSQDYAPTTTSEAVEPGPMGADPILPEDADGHMLMVTGRIIWCSVCGRYQTSKRTCRLREQCPKQTENRSHYRLKRLQEGRRPATGEPLGEIAQRLTLARWSADVAISACKKGGKGTEESLTSGQTRSGEAEASTDG